MYKKGELIYALERCINGNCISGRAKCDGSDEYCCLKKDVLEFLKTHKDIAHTVKPCPRELSDDCKAWLSGMTAEEAFQNIVDIAIDWDGYRNADDLGSLINELLAYADFAKDKEHEAVKAREPHIITIDEVVSNGTLGDVVWLETYYDGKTGIEPFMIDVDISSQMPVLVNAHDEYINGRAQELIDQITETFSESAIDKRFRFWSAYPTDDERKETPWSL